jgi:hypothetical protein
LGGKLLRESSLSIAKKLILKGVIYKRISISIIAQFQSLSTQSINRQSRSFDQKGELI